MTGPTFRAFVAIALPEGSRQAIAGLLDQLHRADSRRTVRWVRPEGVHLTLQFLGETPEALVEALQSVLSTAAARHQSFRLRLGGLGSFPNSPSRRARVLWVGLEGETEALAGLQRDVAAALETIGFVPEPRAFSPHLTLGRVPGGNADVRELYGRVSWPAGASEFSALGVSLMQSRLLPQGAQYTQRLFIPLLQP